MRKHLLLFFVSISAAALSQKWCPPGANWIYEIGGFGTDGQIEYAYTKDTLIQGKMCKKISGTFAGKRGSAPYTVDPNFEHFFSYEDNNVVYVYNGIGIFDTVADFKASVGDKWRVPFDCEYRLTLTVTDTSSK